MGQIIDLTGKTFGRWHVLGLSTRRSKDGKGLYWHCECQCENRTKREVFGGDLKRSSGAHNHSHSCGCLMREMSSIRKTTHGLSEHPGYRSWIEARQRCGNLNNDGYALYRGRGIRMCRRWNDFAKFWEDMGPTWQPGLSIDRIRSGKGYSPANCRWATPKEQANNRRTNHRIKTPDGWMNVTQAAEYYGLTPITIFSRIRYGWTGYALVQPTRQSTKR